MSTYLFIVFLSFLLNSACIIPFINFLYRIKFQRAYQETMDAFNKPTPIFDKFHRHKTGTPVGGGILIVLTTLSVFFMALLAYALFNKRILANYPSTVAEVKILLFTFVSFAFLGIYDDLNKIFRWQKENFFGLRMRHKLILEIILSIIISFWLVTDLKIDIIH
ncbi:hypothetical protein HY214_00670, partial [Candidatus Roizmanbacteria bacterium]|nr:hypothetical protein [Candidatus Roizmanbacteria bacterium]